MKTDSLMLAGGLTLGTLLVVGAGVGGYLLLRRAPLGSAVAPATGTGRSGLVIGNGVIAPVGAGAAGSQTVAQQLAAERAREEAWRRADKILQLERELAGVQNEIKLLTDQLNTIDATPVDAGLRARIAEQEWTSCRNSGAWLTQALRCNNSNMDPRVEAAVQAAWAEQQAQLRRPLLTRGSALNAQQLSLIQNLAQLGVVKQPINARTA